MSVNDPAKQRERALQAAKITLHAAQRLQERMGCRKVVAHIAKVKREGKFLWTNENGDYALGRKLQGKVPYMYVFTADGWLKTVMRREK